MKRFIFLVLTSIIWVNWGVTQTTLPIDTVNICAIRVEFVQDDNRLTTGNGKFMIDTVTTDPYAIDPTPHNRQYFQDQIKAAANYFHRVSAGRLVIKGDVFPLAENGAYQLSNEMGYYNPNTTDAEINLGLSQLFTEAIEVAAQDPAINFSQYDLVVVFHAGVGKDIAFDFDPTPQDIPSLFITHDFLKESLGSGFPGVNTNGGYITQGILLPETQNQEGEKIALKGFFVANIGSYLGLYDLFSPSRQRSGIGRFGLMDVGLLNMNGLVPSPPGAFSRQLLGWDEAVVIDRPTTAIEVARLAANVPGKPTLIKIPINDDEYFLIEYRGDSRVNMEELFRELLEGRTEVPSYLEVLKTHFADQIEIGASGVLLSVPDYDWGLPGAGILIWHIDERIIAEKGPVNRINDDPAQRGVDIEEADGSQDIGQRYFFLQPGYQTELGWLADFWFRNRPDYLKGFELYKNEFSTYTAPNTRANLNNAISHITLNNFSDNTTDIMTFNFSRDIYKKGFPLSLFETPAGHVSMISGAVQDRANECVFIATDRGDVFALADSAGTPTGLFNSNDFLIGTFPANIKPFSMALAKSTGSDGNDLLVLAAGNSVYGFSLTSPAGPGQGNAAIVFETELPQPVLGTVVTASERVYVPAANNTVVILHTDGGVDEIIPTGHRIEDVVVGFDGNIATGNKPISYAVLAPLQQENRFDLVIYDQTSVFFSIVDADGEVLQSFTPAAIPTGQFAMADLDGNATPDILFNGADGIYAYNQGGFLVSGFPIRPTLAPMDTLIGTPLLCDVNRDGVADIIIATKLGQVMAFTLNGQSIADYQLATGGQMSTSPMVMSWDDASGLELVAVSNSGTLYAWQLPTVAGDPNNLWLQSDLNGSNNAVLPVFAPYQPLAESLLPVERVFNYPNPNEEGFTTIRYYLNETATVTIRIFDTAGTLVDRFNGPGEAGVDNEIPWDVRGVASGVYLCQVEARSESRSQTRIIKIMVVH